jgi:hypothetical protein
VLTEDGTVETNYDEGASSASYARTKAAAELACGGGPERKSPRGGPRRRSPTRSPRLSARASHFHHRPLRLTVPDRRRRSH